jgi:CDP-paratose 2-epimerase
MKWFITGGCGFVGSNLTDALLTMGDEVIILDDLSRVGSRDNLSWLHSRHGVEWRFIEDDIRDTDVVSQNIQDTKPDVLAHLAGQVAMTTSLHNPRFDFEVNVLGTINVLEAVRTFSSETIVLYSSTNKVYGELAWVDYEEHETRYVAPHYPNGFDETIPLNFHSPYGCSKGAADQYMLDYARMFDLRTVVFRHSSMYGGRQFATYDQGWIGWFCLKALEMADSDAQPFTISGNGKQVRDVLHATDLVAVYLKAIEHIHRASGHVYNIGGGPENSLSLLELFALLERLTGNTMRFVHIEERAGDQKVFVACIGKAAQMIKWKPQFHIKNGIKEMVEWCKVIL